MKTLCGIAVVGLALLVAAGTSPEAPGDQGDSDGNSLLRMCSDSIRLYDAGGKVSADVANRAFQCVGYVDGLLAMHTAYISLRPLPSPLLCLPSEGILVIQGIRIIVHYLQSHPEQLHLTARVLAILAFHDAFPCAPAAVRPQR
jgi:Rap1a immunity proteins